eukprot:scaffold1542_cov49-Attheya_sp.AAC.2
MVCDGVMAGTQQFQIENATRGGWRQRAERFIECKEDIRDTAQCTGITMMRCTVTASKSAVGWIVLLAATLLGCISVPTSQAFLASASFTGSAWHAVSSQRIVDVFMVPTEKKRIGVYPTASVEEAADELLDLALMRSKGQGGDVMNSRMDELMQLLIESRVKYDPNVILNGPLYAVQYQTGPVPSWEKFSQLSPMGKPNLKGQQYTLIESPGSSDTISPPTYQRVPLILKHNFVTKAVSVQAYGKCVSDTSTTESTKEENKKEQLLNPLEAMKGFFEKDKMGGNNHVGLAQCPADYTVDAYKVAISILGKRVASFGISGRGFMRVLYADPQMRIFTAPQDTTDDSIGEKAGLTVLQIRVDLIDSSFGMLDPL